MKTIGRMLLLAVVALSTIGCEVYRTNEGVGVTGPTGGYFWCDNETTCYGTPN